MYVILQHRALTPLYCCQTGTLVRAAVSRGAGHPGSLGLGRLKIPEGKQMLSINHHVCTNRQGIVPHSFEFWEWLGPSPNPGPQMPAKGQPSKLSFQRTVVRPAMFTLPCMFIVSVHTMAGRQMIIFPLYSEETGVPQVTKLKGERARRTPSSQESSLFFKVPSKADILSAMNLVLPTVIRHTRFYHLFLC